MLFEPIVCRRGDGLSQFLQWALENGYARKVDFSTPVPIEKLGIQPMNMPTGEIFVMNPTIKGNI
jgi:hypothetical protein